MGNFKTKCLFLIEILLLLCLDTMQQEHQHNATTVEYMLSSSSRCKDCPTPQGDKELCWGYEKSCSKEKRLFVPRCEKTEKFR